MSAVSQDEQRAQAEEMLGDRLETPGFVKSLFWGKPAWDTLAPYPAPASSDTQARIEQLRSFCRDSVDPVAIDRQASIPVEVVRGLGKLGVLGACLPRSCGGLDLSQTDYCRLLEVLGGHCGSTALFVNAHHSIGPRAIVLFGTEEQRSEHLPRLASGEWISAFALTETQAGSDAANVQTRAEPTADGTGFVLNGEKRWITNGGLAQVLTVMARTPLADGKSAVTAFLVSPEMSGFEVLEKRMEKCGVRGTATSRLAFRDMFVPRENILGTEGKGLKIALTVLDFGRTTFGACCSGAASFCVERAVEHANRRVQFGKRLGEFELVKQKLSAMQASTYAMQACTYQTAALIDQGKSDFMLETALLKVFATDSVWRIVNDTIQIHGGKAYFTDEPFERMLRDARINQIGEGANDVLRVFSSLVGLRDVGVELQGMLEGAGWSSLVRMGRFAGHRLGAFMSPGELRVRHAELETPAAELAELTEKFSRQVLWLLSRYQESIVDRQYQLKRVSDIVAELYASLCVLRRWDSSLSVSTSPEARKLERFTATYFMTGSRRRIQRYLRDLTSNSDSATTELANYLLAQDANASR